MDDPPTCAPASLRELFVADHRRIEELFCRVMDAVEAGDRSRVGVLWREFGEWVGRHMRAEESAVFPALLAAHRVEIRVLLEEHRHIRTRLVEIGVLVDAASRPETARSFVDELRAHASHEQAVLYRVADEKMTDADRLSAAAALSSPTTSA